MVKLWSPVKVNVHWPDCVPPETVCTGTVSADLGALEAAPAQDKKKAGPIKAPQSNTLMHGFILSTPVVKVRRLVVPFSVGLRD